MAISFCLNFIYLLDQGGQKLAFFFFHLNNIANTLNNLVTYSNLKFSEYYLLKEILISVKKIFSKKMR